MVYFRVINFNGMNEEERKRITERSRSEIFRLKGDVEKIVEDVRNRGDKAITDYLSNVFGRKIEPSELVVEEDELERDYMSLPQELKKSLKYMIKNVTKFHKRQIPKGFEIQTDKGVFAGMYFVPISSAGLYVPSGKGSFPSVAVMLIAPAKVAGVKRIAMATPPIDKELHIDKATAAVAYMMGLKEVYAIGGAHAVAAFAYGTDTVKRTDIIAGPGGPYTFLAKMISCDSVKFDLPAGPSEGMILSDGNADPEVVAWNLVNEAEHGPDSAGILVTTSEEFADKVSHYADSIIDQLPEPRRSFMIENTKKYSAIIIFDNLNDAVNFIAEYAPEHLSIESSRADEIFNKYRENLRAGTITINTPFSAGNYGIGPNSTLPTMGFARSYSGLSIYNFLTSITTERINREGWQRMKEHVIRLADYESFPAHLGSMMVSEKRWKKT
ncbi:MAG: histidinol dehydrogenase [Nitrososphaeria archaeon]|nr:histidinol dehydrogenase [Conexivisphaerales archaeon]